VDATAADPRTADLLDLPRREPVLSNIPNSVVLNEDAPLLGAAHQALGTVSKKRRERHEILFELRPQREGQPRRTGLSHFSFPM
jgi:hypothetical protein